MALRGEHVLPVLPPLGRALHHIEFGDIEAKASFNCGLKIQRTVYVAIGKSKPLN